jgi:hypothetical protein
MVCPTCITLLLPVGALQAGLTPPGGQFIDIGDRPSFNSVAPGWLRRLFRALAVREADRRLRTLDHSVQQTRRNGGALKREVTERAAERDWREGVNANGAGIKGDYNLTGRPFEGRYKSGGGPEGIVRCRSAFNSFRTGHSLNPRKNHIAILRIGTKHNDLSNCA